MPKFQIEETTVHEVDAPTAADALTHYLDAARNPESDSVVLLGVNERSVYDDAGELVDLDEDAVLAEAA